jgi:drug/metabolite transporter (DMT)-like permease
VAWAIFISRAVPTVVLSVVFSIRRPSLRPTLQLRTAGEILAQAIFGFVATTLYAFATLHGQLAIVSVLGSLYPAVTVLLAYRLLGERLGGIQQLGILAVLGGVVLLSV